MQPINQMNSFSSRDKNSWQITTKRAARPTCLPISFWGTVNHGVSPSMRIGDKRSNGFRFTPILQSRNGFMILRRVGFQFFSSN
jgi:hypothetical protein